MLYYASFIPGLQDFIAGVVRERLGDVVIHRLLDGAVVFETSLGYDRLNFFCFNNIFAVINIMENSSLEEHMAAVAQGRLLPAGETVIAHNSRKFRTFRVVVSRENKPAAINEKFRLMAEQYITKNSGLKANRAKPDTEFWFLLRRDRTKDGVDFSLFMKRLTLRPSWEKTLHPGELPPPLAWTLCRMGNLQHGDTILDPFCGYGSIPRAALKYFHTARCIACDSDEKAAAYTAGRFKNYYIPTDKYINNLPGTNTLPKQHAPSFQGGVVDFRSLPSVLPEKSVDAVITDPPWGHYGDDHHRDISVTSLYEEMFNVFDILLKPNGRVVILGARTGELPGASRAHAVRDRFTLQENIPILLSGKKAAIYRFCPG